MHLQKDGEEIGSNCLKLAASQVSQLASVIAKKLLIFLIFFLPLQV